MGGRRFFASVGTLLAAMLLAAPAAQASFHLIKVREVYPGSVAQPESSYVELQMYSEGQNFVANQAVTLYNSTGTLIGTFAFGSSLPGFGSNQQTILVGDSGVQAAFGVAPDLESSSFNVPASGGAACWAGSIDCVAWGNFNGTTPSAAAVGNPVDASGIPNGMAIRRSISGGTCTNLLDGADDTNDSAADFSNAAPAPQSYATVPPSMSCTPPPNPPDTTITAESKPPNPTNSTEAAFEFTAIPPEEASFECRLDSAPEFTPCTSPKQYSGLAAGAGTSHTFRVRAVHPTNGADPTPATYTWTIDTEPPEVEIKTHPEDPSPGNSAAFTYSSNETVSGFECSLEPAGEPAVFTGCPSTGKTYPDAEHPAPLASGEWTFEVRATDKAGNQSTPEPSPDGTFTWTVDNSLLDTTPPQTTIVSKPPDPSGSSTAGFAYESNEPGSSFECRLDGAGFASCPAAGIAYTGLADGSHTFQVRAIDPSGNVDPTPAGYTFAVALAGSLPSEPAPIAMPPLPPNTTIFARPRTRTRDRTPTLRFYSNLPGSTFQCSVDRRPFRPCRSPFTTKPLSPGRHLIRVRASAGGLLDGTPATVRIRVLRGHGGAR